MKGRSETRILRSLPPSARELRENSGPHEEARSAAADGARRRIPNGPKVPFWGGKERSAQPAVRKGALSERGHRGRRQGGISEAFSRRSVETKDRQKRASKGLFGGKEGTRANSRGHVTPRPKARLLTRHERRILGLYIPKDKGHATTSPSGIRTRKEAFFSALFNPARTDLQAGNPAGVPSQSRHSATQRGHFALHDSEQGRLAPEHLACVCLGPSAPPGGRQRTSVRPERSRSTAAVALARG